jgi:hypothetical protein
MLCEDDPLNTISPAVCSREPLRVSEPAILSWEELLFKVRLEPEVMVILFTACASTIIGWFDVGTITTLSVVTGARPQPQLPAVAQAELVVPFHTFLMLTVTAREADVSLKQLPELTTRLNQVVADKVDGV